MFTKTKSGCECFPKIIFLRQIFLFFSFCAPWHNKRLHHIEHGYQNFFINDFKVWTSKWLEPFKFVLLWNQLFGECNNVGDIKILGFSHQIMQLIILINHIRDRVVLKYLEIFIVLWKKMVVKWLIETNSKDP